ncbi:hypothetical protein [Brevundimonas guildfordensis]|uniref:Uncharacterized protein n=1 Tax=Brevundimonas guildfordensis TaxID=2762241 RepID=A0ABR8QZK6_9CAUL|nr:hypothetical protein [Brevundimonas guildfordensis]MBD7940904.1 hypothetical protein [Brevundimonas guildfordensis]
MSAEVEKLAAYLEDAVVSLHHRFSYGYGGLQGSQNAPAPRSFEGRLRLLIERHFVDALRMNGRAVDVWLDYPADDDADLDTLRPSALVVARQGCLAPITIGLGWPARGLKTLRLNPPTAVASRPVTILLGASDAGEALTTALSQMIAAAVVSLDGDAALEEAA